MSEPMSPPNADDAALAKEMNELSVQERERVFEEIHGVAKEREEKPEFIAACLEKLDACVRKLSRPKRTDLDRALFLKPNLLKDSKFKLMFLRSEHYDAKKAADRMARFFSFKRDLFGDEKLVKKITLDDLDDDDIEAAKAGRIALQLPKPDRSGRPVLFVDATRSTYQNSAQLDRFRFYSIMRTLDDEAAQRKGIAFVIYSPSTEFIAGRYPTPSEALETLQKHAVIKNSLPVRISSFHYCYDNPMKRFFIAVIRTAMGKDVRLRLRTHFGSSTEIRYSLGSFGIVTDGIALTKGDLDQHLLCQQYMERRRKAESLAQEEDANLVRSNGSIAFPLPNDVLLGRGRPIQAFPGNLKFATLIDTELERYKACFHLFEKTIVLKDVIQKVHDSGGSFLKRSPDGWEIVDEAVVMEKIRKAFQAKPGGGTATASIRHDGPVSSNKSAKRLKVDQSIGKEEG